MKIFDRFLISTFVFATFQIAKSVWIKLAEPVVKTELTLNTVNGGYVDYSAQSFYNNINAWMTILFAFVLVFWTFWPVLKSKIKQNGN